MPEKREATSICVFGLGLMGRPLARALTAAGYEVRGWNRSPLEREVVEGITVYADLAEAGDTEVALLMLADSDAVRLVLARLEEHLRPGAVVLDMGSSDPSDSRARAARLAAKGVGWVDAPVSGGPEGVRSRDLAIMAGGTERDFLRVRPILRTLGTVVHVGEPGAGHTVKIINPTIVGLTIEAVAEALALAERSGLDLRLVKEALAGGSADSRILQVHGERMIEHGYAPGAKVTTMLKDLRMAAELASRLGVDLPHVSSTVQLYETLVSQGEGDLDCSALHKLRLLPA